MTSYAQYIKRVKSRISSSPMIDVAFHARICFNTCMTTNAELSLRDRAPGFARIYNGERSIGTVTRADFAPLWTIKISRKTIGQCATRENAPAVVATYLAR